MLFEVVVDIADLESGRTFQRRFTRSPIWIGKDPANDLLLEGAAVGARHGDLVFGCGGLLQYWDYGTAAPTRVNGVRVPRGVGVPLPSPGVLFVGNYALKPMLRPAVVAHHRSLRVDEVRFISSMDAPRAALGPNALPHWEPARITTVACRAFDLATAIASLLVKIRSRLAFPLPSAVYQFADESDIVDYLLDPNGLGERLEALALLVSAIVDWREFGGGRTPTAQA
jgi:hypothetical protein